MSADAVLLRVTPWLRVSVVKVLLLIFPVAYGLLPLAWGVVAFGLLLWPVQIAYSKQQLNAIPMQLTPSFKV